MSEYRDGEFSRCINLYIYFYEINYMRLFMYKNLYRSNLWANSRCGNVNFYNKNFKECNERLKKSVSQKVSKTGRTEAFLSKHADGTVLKIEMAGSGFERWITSKDKKADKMSGKGISFIRQKDGKDQKGKKYTYTRSGPQPLSGLSDSGDNSIKNNVKETLSYIKNKVESTGIAQKPVLILIKGHSRNAVAAGQVANELAKWLAEEGLRNIDVELVAFDPVPGPMHEGEDVDIEISSSVKSTVVYSYHTQYPVLFNPQIVRGAGRVIIADGKHDAGIEKGFNYLGKNYHGSTLNDLPEGVYLQDGSLNLVDLDSPPWDKKIWNNGFYFQNDRREVIREAAFDSIQGRVHKNKNKFLTEDF